MLPITYPESVKVLYLEHTRISILLVSVIKPTGDIYTLLYTLRVTQTMHL